MVLGHGWEKTASLELAVLLGQASVNNTSIGQAVFSLWFAQFKYNLFQETVILVMAPDHYKQWCCKAQMKGAIFSKWVTTTWKVLGKWKRCQKAKDKKMLSRFWKEEEAYLKNINQ